MAGAGLPVAAMALHAPDIKDAAVLSTAEYWQPALVVLVSA